MKFDPDAWTLTRAMWGGLQSILIAPRRNPPALLMSLCHGFGASGTDLVGLNEDLVDFLPDGTALPAFLFPEAPIDLNDEGDGLFDMTSARAWWPLNMAKLMQLAATNSFDAMRNEIPPGIDSAREHLCNAITECKTAHKWDDVPIVLGGFSQGAMLSVDTAMRGGLPNVAGLVAWSGALICESTWREACPTNSLNIPVLQSHGKMDPILPISTGRALHAFLKERGLDAQMIEFSGQHTIGPAAIEATAGLLQSIAVRN